MGYGMDGRTDGYWVFFLLFSEGVMHVSWVRPVSSRVQGGQWHSVSSGMSEHSFGYA